MKPQFKTNGRDRFLCVDGNNYLWRAFYATPRLTNNDGFPTGAIKGFCSILIADYWKLRPKHLAVVFDAATGNQANRKLLAEYKGKRKPEDPEAREIREMCYSQIKPLKRILKALGIRVVSKSGVEGDDVMGTLAVEHERAGLFSIIGTRDKDLAQVVNKNIVRLDPDTRSFIGISGTIDRFGVGPELIVDYLMLTGDGVDNVPGVKGIGPAKATALLTKYGSVSSILKHVDELTPAMKTNVKASRKLLKVTRKVLTLDTAVPMNTTVEDTDLANRELDLDYFNSLCKELGLKSTAKDLLGAFARD